MRVRCSVKYGLLKTSTICAVPAAAFRNAASKSYGGLSSFSARTSKWSVCAIRSAALNWSAVSASQRTAVRFFFRKSLRQHLDLFGGQFELAKCNARNIAARMRKARHIAALDRIVIDRQYDDRNKAAHPHHRLQCDFGAIGPDQIHRRSHQFGSRDECPARVTDPTKFDGEILAFAETQRLQLS